MNTLNIIIKEFHFYTESAINLVYLIEIVVNQRTNVNHEPKFAHYNTSEYEFHHQGPIWLEGGITLLPRSIRGEAW